MITRAYTNADGERQEITLDQSVWEILSEEGLKELLGFKKVVAKEPQPAVKPASNRKKSGGK